MALAGVLGLVAPASPTQPITVASPDGHIAVRITLERDGEPRYVITRDGRNVLEPSALGIIRNDADFSRNLRIAGVTGVERVSDRYEVLTAKRRLNTYRANRRIVHLETAAGAPFDIAFQVSNDGVAFRYVFPDTDASMHDVREERTSFHMLPATRAWIQPIAQAKTGFGNSNPSYEEFYQKDVPVGGDSPTGAGWVYPALFKTGDTWLLISESALGRNWAGTRLRSAAPGGEYRVGLPDPREGIMDGAVNPRSSLPWRSPWRVIVVGSLTTVGESMLGVDVAEPARTRIDSTIVPGKASWSWPLMGDGATNADVQRQFIDYAADMGWRYTLVDALWDTQIGYAKIAELAAYARTKGVRLLLWYNSAGTWNTTPQTPRDRMLTHERRIAEFAQLRDMGIAGIKVDFFGGDGQSVIQYYQDIIDDAASFGLLVNFHGATLPRGWARTYPTLMTMEAVRGLEYVTFSQDNADNEPSHAAMLPFTRNVFDPMDFTPVVLDQIKRIQRRTSSAFELALSVVFTSGIQHYAETPVGMAKAPAYVRDFLRTVPNVWDDVRFLDGEPGKYAVIARRSGTQWFIAGINADTVAREMTLDLRDLPGAGGTLVTDGNVGNLSFRQVAVRFSPRRTMKLVLEPRGGFVLTVYASGRAR
jgi:alpha-glucosidase